MPGLEILNDDVRCTHGATTGQIDQDQLFYLMARGIDPRTGAQLLAHGFFEEVIARLPEKKIGEAVRSAVAAKFAAMRSLPSEQGKRGSRPEGRLEKESETLDVRALQGLSH
jgi:hypothetical protein